MISDYPCFLGPPGSPPPGAADPPGAGSGEPPVIIDPPGNWVITIDPWEGEGLPGVFGGGTGTTDPDPPPSEPPTGGGYVPDVTGLPEINSIPVQILFKGFIDKSDYTNTGDSPLISGKYDRWVLTVEGIKTDNEVLGACIITPREETTKANFQSGPNDLDDVIFNQIFLSEKSTGKAIIVQETTDPPGGNYSPTIPSPSGNLVMNDIHNTNLLVNHEYFSKIGDGAWGGGTITLIFTHTIDILKGSFGHHKIKKKFLKYLQLYTLENADVDWQNYEWPPIGANAPNKTGETENSLITLDPQTPSFIEIANSITKESGFDFGITTNDVEMKSNITQKYRDILYNLPYSGQRISESMVNAGLRRKIFSGQVTDIELNALKSIAQDLIEEEEVIISDPLIVNKSGFGTSIRDSNNERKNANINPISLEEEDDFNPYDYAMENRVSLTGSDWSFFWEPFIDLFYIVDEDLGTEKPHTLRISDRNKLFKYFEERDNIVLSVATDADDNLEAEYNVEEVLPNMMVLLLDKDNITEEPYSNPYIEMTNAVYTYETDSTVIQEAIKFEAYPHMIAYVDFEDPILDFIINGGTITGTFKDFTLKKFGNSTFARFLPRYFIIIPTNKTENLIYNGMSQLTTWGSRIASFARGPLPRNAPSLLHSMFPIAFTWPEHGKDGVDTSTTEYYLPFVVSGSTSANVKMIEGDSVLQYPWVSGIPFYVHSTSGDLAPVNPIPRLKYRQHDGTISNILLVVTSGVSVGKGVNLDTQSRGLTFDSTPLLADPSLNYKTGSQPTTRRKTNLRKWIDVINLLNDSYTLVNDTLNINDMHTFTKPSEFYGYYSGNTPEFIREKIKNGFYTGIPIIETDPKGEQEPGDIEYSGWTNITTAKVENAPSRGSGGSGGTGGEGPGDDLRP